jgi:hypothetical protein
MQNSMKITYFFLTAFSKFSICFQIIFRFFYQVHISTNYEKLCSDSLSFPLLLELGLWCFEGTFNLTKKKVKNITLALLD